MINPLNAHWIESSDEFPLDAQPGAIMWFEGNSHCKAAGLYSLSDDGNWKPLGWDSVRNNVSAATNPINSGYGQITSNGHGGNISVNTNTLQANSIGSQPIYGYITGSGIGDIVVGSKNIPTSPNLPEIELIGYDENQRKVALLLRPERTISAYESLQITMMLMAYCDSPDTFCPLAFVRKHNLERHFKFE